MALSVSYGLLFGATLTLIFLPVYMKLLNRIRLLARQFITGNKVMPREVEPAVKELISLEQYFGEEDEYTK